MVGEQEGVERRDVGRQRAGAFQAEVLQHGGQQLRPLQEGVEHQRRNHVLRGQVRHQPPHQRALAHADLGREQREALAREHAVLQLHQLLVQVRGREIAARVGRVGKGVAHQAQVAQVAVAGVHGLVSLRANWSTAVRSTAEFGF
ncbi:hypothetical protein D9M69_608170 [compost metagenome]